MLNKKVPEPRISLENSPEYSEKLAQREAEDFSDEKLEQKAKNSEHSRKELSRKILHKCNICLIIILYSLMIIGVSFLGWHWLSPEKWHFLTQAQIDTIKTILFSALATSVAREYIRASLYNKP